MTTSRRGPQVPTYAIGDVQGCFKTLRALLRQVRFDELQDRLWLVGDLVNRGRHSLDVLRYLRGLGDRVTTVLGNHDIHLIGRAHNLRSCKKSDTLEEVLGAPDLTDLMGWLRSRPLVHREGRYFMVHAGLLPSWTFADAESRARRLESELTRDDGLPRIIGAEGNDPDLRVFTTIRTCNGIGEMSKFNGSPALAPPGQQPWYSWPTPRSPDSIIIFGHWAAHGVRITGNLAALDSGCVWGRHLTAWCLDDGQLYSQPLEPGDV